MRRWKLLNVARKRRKRNLAVDDKWEDAPYASSTSYIMEPGSKTGIKGMQ